MLALLGKLFLGVLFLDTKKIGNLTELQCMTYLYELGYAISIPFGNSEKYDFIIDVNDVLYKIQCKHSSEYKDEQGNIKYIKFKSTWQSHNAKGYSRQKYQLNEIDFFATFYQNRCYLIPAKECSYEKRLRLETTKNNQLKGISYLSNYLAEKTLSQL